MTKKGFLLLLLTTATSFGFLQTSKLGVDEKPRRSEKLRTRRRLVQEKFRSELDKLRANNTTSRLLFKGNANRDLQALDEEIDSEEGGDTFIVECSEAPLFKCFTCDAQVDDEQALVWSDIVTLYPDAELLSSTKHLVNALYVKLPVSLEEEEDKSMNALADLEGVRQVTPHGSLEMDVFAAVDYIGGYRAREEFCATGQDIKVAVIDGGVDYTHYYLGGEGTFEAYEDAYGRSFRSAENRQREDFFPTQVVVDGFDFVGEFSIPLADEDPIDAFGHGTAVSHAVLTVAPDAELIALKACSRSMACPVFAIIQALEYALDPNRDGDLEDKADIINLSLGVPFVSPFYNFVAATLETVFELGSLLVVSAGNTGNIPYVIGGLSGSPNSISVGATGHPNDLPNVGVMANYSSRGPGGNNMMKPDIVAPSGLTLAAAGTGTYRYRSIQGTSFSAPLVAGAAAVLMERCPECSPFAIKSLLMNNANRGTRYKRSSSDLSPITWSGAGEMRVDKALDADVWAYSVEDVQPSISLGMINAASDVVVRRTIKVINLSGNAQNLAIGYQLRDPNKPYANALRVNFESSQIELPSGCNSEAYVQITFTVSAVLSPANHMTSTGRAGFDPTNLDLHEFGGHITIGSSLKDISIPFVAIIRQASDVRQGETMLRDLRSNVPTNVRVDLLNQGAGKAQVDAFQLLLVSGDDGESSFGEDIVPNDFRYAGYRVLEVGRPGCTHLVEFAINTWERESGRLVSQVYGVDIDVDGDEEGDRFLFNSGLARECFVADLASGETLCTGMAPDHGTSSSITILRACSEDLGIAELSGQIGVRFEAVSFTQEGRIVTTDASSEEDFIMIDFPKPGLSAPSYDILPGDTLEVMQVDGSGAGSTPGSGPFGLMLVTNAYRTVNSTGAATPSSEALILLREGYNYDRLPQEITPDVLEFPVAQDLTGPLCSSWKSVDSSCVATAGIGDDADTDTDTLESPIAGEDSMLDPVLPALNGIQLTQQQGSAEAIPTCPPVSVPRADVPTLPPTSQPLPTTPRPTLFAGSPILIPVIISPQEAPTPSMVEKLENRDGSTASSTSSSVKSEQNPASLSSGANSSWSFSSACLAAAFVLICFR